MNILIVGAGLSGSTLAERFANIGYTVTVIEKRNHIAGNCYDFHHKTGILMNHYGAHIFHTSSERVWEYVNRFSQWVNWHHKVIGKICDKLFPIPINIDTVNTLCDTTISNEEDMKAWLSKNTIDIETPTNSEDVALKRVGPLLYKAIFKDYTYKQWAKYPSELDPSVLERIPVRTDYNGDYFSDKHQALPEKGYTEFIRAMLTHPNITVKLNTEYTPAMAKDYKFVFYTGPIDTYYASYNYPKLEYRSIHFEEETLDIDHYQKNSVVNYPSIEDPFTRIVEYKHFLNQHVPGKTVIVKEYTTEEGDPYYPVPTKKNQETYKLYQGLAKADEASGIYFIGRLANYKYYNMDAAILNALEFFDRFLYTRAV
jgi:UDP-galactopyranose mutase